MVALVVPPGFTDEHELLRQTVRQFVQNRVEPQAMEHDQSATFNTALLAELGGARACSASRSPRPTAAPGWTRPHR